MNLWMMVDITAELNRFIYLLNYLSQTKHLHILNIVKRSDGATSGNIVRYYIVCRHDSSITYQYLTSNFITTNTNARNRSNSYMNVDGYELVMVRESFPNIFCRGSLLNAEIDVDLYAKEVVKSQVQSEVQEVVDKCRYSNPARNTNIDGFTNNNKIHIYVGVAAIVYIAFASISQTA